MKFLTKFIKEYKIAIICLIIISVFRSLFFNFYIVPSGSMYPNLKIGQLIFTNRIELGIKIPFTSSYSYMWGKINRGDVVVAQEPGSKITIVKRVIGISGDKISIINGNVIRNGIEAHYELFPESLKDPDMKYKTQGYKEIWNDNSYEYINKSIEKLPYDSKQNFKEIIVPQGKILLLGDNRDNSKDGRWFGFVSEKNIYGKVLNGNRYN